MPKVVNRKPNKKHWVRDSHRIRHKGTSNYTKPFTSMIDRAKKYEKMGFDTRIWKDQIAPSWVLFKSRRRKN